MRSLFHEGTARPVDPPAGRILAGAGQSAAMPDRESFFAEARKRLASNDLLQTGYAYRERVTEVRMNPFGRIGTGPVEVYDVYPVAGKALTYRRLIETRRRGCAARRTCGQRYRVPRAVSGVAPDRGERRAKRT